MSTARQYYIVANKFGTVPAGGRLLFWIINYNFNYLIYIESNTICINLIY